MDNTKGQKLIAALYLVSQHLSDTDPMKRTLRENSIRLVEADMAGAAEIARNLDTLLGACTMSHLITEKNASIIRLEIGRYVNTSLDMQTEQLAHMFIESAQQLSTQTPHRPVKMSFSLPRQKSITDNKTVRSFSEIFENKNKRQDAILSFINVRKAASIKDISTLFPDVSEKTIQRELGTLVAHGKITKRGEKRWSIYMAVTAKTNAL